MEISARFDALSKGAANSFRFSGLVETLVASTTAEVIPVFAAAETAIDAGYFIAGYVGYEAAAGLEPSLTVQPSPPNATPLIAFGVFDKRIDVEPITSGPVGATYSVSPWRSQITEREHRAGVDAIRAAIRAGDTYQVNYTFQLEADFAGDPHAFYRDLIEAQRGRYGALIDCGRFQILSASPEQFFSLRGRQLHMTPMKGTMPRGRWLSEDLELSAELAASPKDRAENLMIVDLIRNDIGRIAEYGSVKVDDLFAVEPYETVWQMTSKVRATVREYVHLTDVFTALFPSGSITGAPKASTMKHIAALEKSARGVYCGSVGWMGRDDAGELCGEFNVAIRTVTIDTQRGTAIYGTGGAITWDSEPSSEYDEARWKARLLTTRRPDMSLIETMRWDPEGGFMFLNEHLDRIVESGVFFGFDVRRGAIVEALELVASSASAPHITRVAVDRDGSVEVEQREQGLACFASDLVADAKAVHLALSPTPIDVDDVFWYHKTTQRSGYDRRLEAVDGEDVLLVNPQGNITETTTSNVVLLIDGVFYTPPRRDGLLCGVYRNELVRSGQLVERSLSIQDLAGAESVALINSVRGWRRATYMNS